MVARLGGDEFAVLHAPPSIRRRPSCWRSASSRPCAVPYDMEGQRAIISVSIGIAMASKDGDERRHAAEKRRHGALSGEGGWPRDTIASSRPRWMRKCRRGARWSSICARRCERRTRGLLPADFDLVADRSPALRRCLRWNHPTRGMISPGQFIPLAEEIGLDSVDWRMGAGQGMRAMRRLAGPSESRGKPVAGAIPQR